MLSVLVLVLVALSVAFYFLVGQDGGSLEGGEIALLIGGGALATVYLLSLAGDYRGRALTAFKHAGVWLALVLALIIGYSYRGELSDVAYRVAGEVLPPSRGLVVRSGPEGQRAVQLRKGSNGHFSARGSINGAAVTMLVDTGASTVVLRPADAERAGIDTASLVYSIPVSTANGTTYAAPVRLKSIAIGPLEVRDVEALIAQPGNLNESLLGMSFLRRLQSYEVIGDFLTLRG